MEFTLQCALIHICSDAVGLCVDIRYHARVSYTKNFWMLCVARGYMLSRSRRINSSLPSFKISVCSNAVGCADIGFCTPIHAYDRFCSMLS